MNEKDYCYWQYKQSRFKWVSHLGPSPRGRAAGTLAMHDSALAAWGVEMLLAMENLLVNAMLL